MSATRWGAPRGRWADSISLKAIARARQSRLAGEEDHDHPAQHGPAVEPAAARRRWLGAIDYVRGRPSLTACPKVFVKHRCLLGTFGALRGAPPGWHGPRRA
jgi:hypothetical protein